MSLVSRPEGFSAYGVDGCPAGWFAVELKASGEFDWQVVSALGDLVNYAGDADRIFVDIPIGLPVGSGERECDQEARKVLGRPRASSVFRAPVRAALAARDYANACDISRTATAIGNTKGKGITKQTYAIIPKLQEVDTLLRDSAKARRLVREVHPEVCFWALAGMPMKHGKKRSAGFDERLKALRTVWQSVDVLVADVLAKTLRKCVGRDDILDAAVAALTACQDESALNRLPEKRVEDECGLPMQMVYALS